MLFHLQRNIVVMLVALVMAAVTAQHSAARDTISAQQLVRDFACIHHYEGAWNDPNKPYWGGLQMDMPFQRTYGKEYLRAFGTADHWPPGIQIAVAIKAYLSGRGFGPWPNTARRCGLS